MIKKYFYMILFVTALIGFIYSMTVIAKNVSYSIFYEDKVIETINKKVKGSCLK